MQLNLKIYAKTLNTHQHTTAVNKNSEIII